MAKLFNTLYMKRQVGSNVSFFNLNGVSLLKIYVKLSKLKIEAVLKKFIKALVTIIASSGCGQSLTLNSIPTVLIKIQNFLNYPIAWQFLLPITCRIAARRGWLVAGTAQVGYFVQKLKPKRRAHHYGKHGTHQAHNFREP